MHDMCWSIYHGSVYFDVWVPGANAHQRLEFRVRCKLMVLLVSFP
jgi:hypothetical protein